MLHRLHKFMASQSQRAGIAESVNDNVVHPFAIKGTQIKSKIAVVHPTSQPKAFQVPRESNEYSSTLIVEVTRSVWAWVSGLTIMWTGVCHEREIRQPIMNWTKLISSTENTHKIKVSQQNKEDGHFKGLREIRKRERSLSFPGFPSCSRVCIMRCS